MNTKQQFISDLAALGVTPGDAIMVHSSYKSLGGIEDGARGLFDAFLSYLGQNGTLMLPAFSFSTVTREVPYFDVRSTPSCIGYLPEYFRTAVPGVLRSLHPTHSCCAIGRHAQYLTEVHFLDRTPVGPHSPIALLPKIGGKILILGSHPDHNTTLHGVEETAEPEYLFNRTAPIVYTITDANGKTTSVTHLCHGFYTPTAEYLQKYARILDILPPDTFTRGKILDADCVLMDAAAVWEYGHAALVRDPLFFVDVIPYTQS